MKTPKITGIEIRKFDWHGWIMCLIGLIALYFNLVNENYWVAVAVFFCFLEYVTRVSFGRVYKHVFYDTILWPMYELEIGLAGETYFVCAENENELALYVETHYPGMEYRILRETHVESFIKTEEFK